jgi:hypothetical protein
LKISEIPWQLPATIFGLIGIILIGLGIIGFEIKWNGEKFVGITYKKAIRPQSTYIAQSMFYSALNSNKDHSVIVIPLESNQVDLDAECHKTINTGWHAGGVAKGRYFDQDCTQELDNDLYSGNYTSYVKEETFENNRDQYNSCNASNSFICCSQQFPN